MPKHPPTRNDDHETEDDVALEPDTAVVSGSVAGTDANEAGDLLLELSTAIFKLSVLLHEADETDWRALQPRMIAFRAVVDSLPVEPKRRRAIGFTPPRKTAPAAKRVRK